MYYAIISQDIDNSLAKRLRVRDQHVARLQALRQAGRLLTAGPHPSIDSEEPGQNGFTGSLIIAEFDSIDAAQMWADADPYISEGVYQNSIVKPYKKVF